MSKIHCNTKYTTNRNHKKKTQIKEAFIDLFFNKIDNVCRNIVCLYSEWVSVEYVRTYLQPVGHLWKLGDGRLFVHKLVPIQVSKLVSIEAHPEVGPKHPLTFLLIKSAIINKCITSFTWPNHTLATYMQKKFKVVINSSNKGQFKCK